MPKIKSQIPSRVLGIGHWNLFVIWCLLFGILPNGSRATHIVGGEITYKLIDSINYVYKVTIKVYRDCYSGIPPFSNPLPLQIIDGATKNVLWTESIIFPGKVELPLTEVNDTCLIVIPDGVCVEEAIYRKEITLPPIAGGYHLTYQICCRNGSIINIIPNWATYTAFIPDTGVAKYYNSNPAFNNFPPILVCKDAPLEFDHSATDLDGDSLVYELCTPYNSGAFPYSPVTWIAPYKKKDPLGGVPLSIDTNGLLTGTPNTIGQFVVGVCVKEYRNGVFLSEGKRDFQFNVTECFNPTVAIVDDVIQSCGDKTITFPNNSISAFAWEWDFGDPTTNADTSILEFPVYTYPDTGTYNVRLIVNPGTFCNDTAYLTAIIKQGMYADFEYIPGCIDNPINFFDATTIIDAGFIVNWDWDFGDGGVDSSQNPTHLYGLPGVYTVKLSVLSNSGCLDTITRLVTVHPLPVFNLGPDTAICEGESLYYNFSSNNSPTYTWTPDNGIKNNGTNMPIVSPDTGITTYYVRAIDANGCEYRDTIFIVVHPVPLVDAGPDSTIDKGAWVILQGQGSGNRITIEWSPEDSLDNITILNPQTVPLFYTTTFYLRVTDQVGCIIRIDSVTIYVRLDPIIEIPTAFTPNGDEKNEIFKLFYYDIEKLVYFRIFNRWGEKIFETTNLEEGWDGTYKGKPQEVGSYVYVAVGESRVDEEIVMIEKKGMVALIR